MSRNLIPILTLALIIVVSFVVVLLAQATLKTTIPEATQKQIEPLNPNLDIGLIEELEALVKSK